MNLYSPTTKHNGGKQSEDEPALFCCINKNLIHHAFARAASRYGLRKRDFHALFYILVEAQRTKKRKVTFRSRYQLIRELGWQNDPRDYRTLEAAFDVWSRSKVRIDGWRDLTEDVKLVRRDGSEYQRRKLDRDRQVRVFDRFWRVTSGDGDLVTVEFDRAFWAANGTGYHAKVYLEGIAKLRTVPEVLLYLHLQAFNKRDAFNIELDTLRGKLCMPHERRKRTLQRLGQIFERVNAATGREFVFRIGFDMKVEITCIGKHDPERYERQRAEVVDFNERMADMKRRWRRPA